MQLIAFDLEALQSDGILPASRNFAGDYTVFDQPWGAEDAWGTTRLSTPRRSGTDETAVTIPFKKTDDDEQIVYGEVYAPNVPDSQGDFMTAETIKAMAHEFMKNGFVSKVDLNHSQEESGSYIVESFIARADDTVFIPDSWVVGVKIPDVAHWELVKSGELNGFSLDGFGVRVPKVLEFDLPDYLIGETDEVEAHKHKFFVKYDESGNFLGGMTDAGPDGHIHPILRGTITEAVNGHGHRFSFVEGFSNAQSPV